MSSLCVFTSLQQAAAKFPDELASLLEINVDQLILAMQAIEPMTKSDAIHRLTKAKHLNEKLAESAVGPDSTMHQYITDEITIVIQNMK